MLISQKIEIDLTKAQKELCSRYFGYSRYIYNKALLYREEKYKEWKSGKIKKLLTVREIRQYVRDTRLDWEKELTTQIVDNTIDDLSEGYFRFFKGLTGKPKLKKKKVNNTFRFHRKSEWTFRIVSDFRLRMNTFKEDIKLKEKIRFNDYIIKQVIISQKADKYFASFILELKENPFTPIKKNNNSYVGVDLGVKKFAVITDEKDETYISDSIINEIKCLYEHVDSLQRFLGFKRVAKIQENRETDSKRYQKAKLKLQRLYLKISRIQSNHVHEVTSFLCKNYKYICIEDLKPSNLIKNRILSNAIKRSMFYEFRRQLEYKAKFYGNTIIVADKFFPSSQICSHCGNVLTGDEKLSLKQRTYRCIDCGTVIDRDINASINLRDYGMRQISCNKQ